VGLHARRRGRREARRDVHLLELPAHHPGLPPRASANDPPPRTIAGDATGLLEIEDIGYDEANDAIVVMDNHLTVRRFARTARGNIAPLTSLTVPNGTTAIAADNFNGELLVAATDAVAVYRFADDGQAAPVRTLSGITGAQGLLVDTDADQLFVLDDFGSMLHVFPRTASRAAAPLRTLNAAQGAFACEGFRMAICN
jgi:hypothetical protein